MAEPLVTLRDVVFAGRGHRALDGVTLRLTARRTCILGPNGAGKSVLLRVMHGLLAPSSGAVRLARVSGQMPPTIALAAGSGDVPGAESGATAELRAPLDALRPPRIAMVFQRPVMLRRSVLGNVLYGLSVNRMHAGAAVRAREVLARVGLATLAARPARVLSGGEQQRVALARAWALQPDVLLLDEPTASLDPHGIRAVEKIINEIADAGTAIIMVTHHRGVAKRLAQDIVFMHQGRVAEHTATAQFFERAQSQAGRDYLRGDLE